MISILVIGGGPGGYVAAIRAAQLGGSVTLVEKERLGGACLNVGCIPTKALLHSAGLYRSAMEGAQAGVIASPKLDFLKVQEHKANITETLVKGVTGLMKANKIKVIKGTASFLDQKTVRVVSESGDEKLSLDKIIIASGSMPFLPPIPGADGPRCIDSTGALGLQSIPKSMVIIGGGVIGVELATIYQAFGAKVSIVEMLPEILPMFDTDIVAPVKQSLEQDGVDIFTASKVLSIENGANAAAVHIQTGQGEKVLEGERVLICIGRRTNTAELGLDSAGISQEQGRIIVNNRMETNIPGVYAIGDCLGRTMLAHVASTQGEIAAENAMGMGKEYDEKTNPSCVYTVPELAMAGLTETQAKERGLDYVIGKFPLSANGKALIENGGKGCVKILAGAKYKEVLGVALVGPRATDLIAQASLAIRLEATVDELISTIYAHPTIGEGVHEAALAVENRAIHIINK